VRYAKIDIATGIFIEDVLADKQTPDLIATAVPRGLYWPKWSNGQWVEGKPQVEIDAIKVAQVVVMQAETNKRTIEEYLTTAIQTDKDYLAITAPTAAQKEVQLNKLSRQNIRIMRLLLNKLDTVE